MTRSRMRNATARGNVPDAPMNDSVPAGRRLERAALERVVLRAAQLQAGSRELEDGLTEDDVLKLGADVGIPAPYLRQALMEERMRAAQPAESSVAGWLAGPRYVVAERAVPLTNERVMQALEHWMADGELLTVRRRHADQTTWEPRRGTIASLKRSFRVGGRNYQLAQAREVAAQASAVDTQRAYVRLAADVGNTRGRRIGGAAALAALGAAAAGLMLAFGVAPLVAILALPAASLGALGVARRHQREAAQVQVALEQVLDRLEHGEIQIPSKTPKGPPPALEWIAGEIRRTLRP
ncbi:MAG: hypothetical protein OEY20_02850 [Gemmatimonadota bacterium]|nr:hypothetical protein [Gemmatimonadota bacterium]